MSVKTGYSGVQIGLHWAIALLIGVNYIVSDGMGRIFDGTLEGKAAVGWTPFIHVYVGLAVLALVLLRLAVRWMQGAPEAKPSGNAMMDRAGEWTHKLLYLLLFLVPGLGAVTWYGGLEATADLHVIVMNAMMILVLLHAAAALFHQYVLKDGLLVRMMRAR
ncbi:MAG: cytochrome b/b6 domain-containing protein [Paracoccaceae bacterium]|nr:cytochrome b/b6 domain-containing protein [Paracoccaceae bacterium]